MPVLDERIVLTVREYELDEALKVFALVEFAAGQNVARWVLFGPVAPQNYVARSPGITLSAAGSGTNTPGLVVRRCESEMLCRPIVYVPLGHFRPTSDHILSFFFIYLHLVLSG